MSKIVNMHEAKTTLSSLVERAMRGEDIIVAKAGTPMVRLVPVARPHRERRSGFWKGKVRMARDFNTLPPEWLDAFEGKER
ncbi:MAG: type II toxin-antitoxin system Phd/YefM family antitoxin [Stellaceae bacterium]